jgi:predicted ATPase
MLTSFSVENYRAFADETKIELRPLTLLFGYNNVGKSALIRALALIADSTKSDLTTPLDLSSEAARGCTFSELCSRLTGSNTAILGLEFARSQGALELLYEVTQPPSTYEQVIDRLEIAFQPSLAKAIPSFLFSDLLPTGNYEIVWDKKSKGQSPINFNGLVPPDETLFVKMNDGGVEDVGLPLKHVALELRALRHSLLWIGSLRNHPERSIQHKPGKRLRVNAAGKGIAEILIQDKLASGPLLPTVSRWYEDNFKRKLDVKQLPDGRFELTLEPLAIEGNRAVNLADTGEGIAQVLPVLVAAAMVQRAGKTDPTILALEQPELHLHPAVHASLAKYLCDIAASKRPRMLVETHSENVLLGVQIQIVKREISPDDVLVYWVKQDEDGSSHVFRATFDTEGYLRGFPENVFNEDLELARKLLDLREQAGA